MKQSPILDYIETVASGIFTPEAWAWLQRGFRAHLDDGEPLDRALRLNCVHSKGARYAVNHRRGIRHIHQAAALIPSSGNPWSTAKLLAREIKVFNSHRWPKLCGLAVAPECLSDLEKELFGAFQAMGSNVPRSANRLVEILTKGAAKP